MQKRKNAKLEITGSNRYIKYLNKHLQEEHPGTKGRTKVKNATFLHWIVALIGLFMNIIAYALFMPIGNILIAVFVENGTPYAQIMFGRNMAIYGLVLTGIGCILWAFFSSYSDTYDTGITEW